MEDIVQGYIITIIFFIYIYDNEKNNLTEPYINRFKKSVPLEISYFKNDKYLFVRNGNFKFDIYDINLNMK